MLKCNDCGQIFDEDELRLSQECVGEFWGVPAFETFYQCPYCGSEDFDEYREEEEEEE